MWMTTIRVMMMMMAVVLMMMTTSVDDCSRDDAFNVVDDDACGGGDVDNVGGDGAIGLMHASVHRHLAPRAYITVPLLCSRGHGHEVHANREQESCEDNDETPVPTDCPARQRQVAPSGLGVARS